LIIVEGRTAIRFKRRWADYLHTLELGTPAVVGISEPGLPDVREAAAKAYDGTTPQWEAADAVLNEAWVVDAVAWPRRLSKFLKPLSQRAQTAFAELVRAGCQPDMLAFQFSEAAQVDQYESDRKHLLTDLDALDILGVQAVAAVRALANRRKVFDEYLEARRLRAIEGDPGDAELKILLMDLEDLVARHDHDNQSLRRHLDRRREHLLGHSEVRLSRRVHEATGAYHDKAVEEILEDIRVGLGRPGRAPGALKKRRKRWRQQFERNSTSETE